MILARHDQHRCRFRVRPSRHGEPLPIDCDGLMQQPNIGLLSPTFGASTGDEPLLGTSRHLTATADGVLASPAHS